MLAQQRVWSTVVPCPESLFEGFTFAIQRGFPDLHNGPGSQGNRGRCAGSGVIEY